MGISVAAASTAGEEEDRILALVLAYPVSARAGAGQGGGCDDQVLIIAVGAFVGLIAGVASAAGVSPWRHIAAYSVHLAFFGLATGAASRSRSVPDRPPRPGLGAAAAVGVAGWLSTAFAPLVGAIEWLKYVSPFYYYAAHDPLTRGIDISDLVVLAGLAVVLTVVGVAGIERRDLRA